MMLIAATLLLIQGVAGAQQVAPVLEFPEAGVDDPASFEGYQTRFFRDAAGNTLQIYINQRDGRVVDVWGNSANESLGFSIRDAAGTPPPIRWGSDRATVSSTGRVQTVEYRLQVDAPAIEIGHFLLGTMRVERDFQHFENHRAAWDAPPFARPELTALIGHVERLDARERQRHLQLLGARRVADLRARMQPTLSLDRPRGASRVRVDHPSFDGRNRLTLELAVEPGTAEISRAGSAVAVRSRGGAPILLTVRVSTDAEPLRPLRYTEIFNEEFLRYMQGLRAERERIEQVVPASRDAAQNDRRLALYRMERQLLGMELLSSREKLMAGLPNYGTYFGRDMLMTALMMEPIWTDAMSEAVIGSVLGKLGPAGEVSHEEALGGQAIRERAEFYNRAMEEHARARAARDRAAAERALAEAREILGGLQVVRESYTMRDDDFQFPVFVGRYLANPSIPAEQKRAFLAAPVPEQGGATRLTLLLRNLAYVARESHAYVREPVATNLIAFPRRTETDWFPGSWRDSNVGYANGRFAMDVNVVWVPAALESLPGIAATLASLGWDAARLEAEAPEIRESPLAAYLRDPGALRAAVRTWNGTARHFEVTLSPAEVRERVEARLARMPEEERAFWSERRQRNAPTEPLRFTALSLDEQGRPIPVVNTDVAMRWYVQDGAIDGEAGPLTREAILADVRSVMLPYPYGLFIQDVGPVIANDAFASPAVWEGFIRDHYHSPRVVWGREVSLVLLGLARQIDLATDAAGAPLRPDLAPYVEELRRALRDTRAAVEASGLEDQELWSYRIEGGELVPLRYAHSTDIQLWNLTALAVQFQLDRMAAARPAVAAQ